jgi:hypothetical protein
MTVGIASIGAKLSKDHLLPTMLVVPKKVFSGAHR